MTDDLHILVEGEHFTLFVKWDVPGKLSLIIGGKHGRGGGVLLTPEDARKVSDYLAKWAVQRELEEVVE